MPTSEVFKSDKNVLSSAQRVLTALQLICLSPRPVSLAMLSQDLKVPSATAYRAAQTLIASGFVQVGGGRQAGYEPTWKVVELSAPLLERSELRSLAEPFLRRLADKYSEPVTLAVPDSAEVLFVDRISSARNFEFYCDVGRKLPLHVGAAARSMLAHYPDELFERYLDRDLIRFTPSTKCSATELRADRILTRNQGFTISREDVEVGITGIAAAILNSRGEILGAAAIANLSARWSDQEIQARGEAIAQICSEISRECAHLTQSLAIATAR